MYSRKIAAIGAVALAASAVFPSTALAAESDGSPGASARLIGGQPAPASVTWTGVLKFDAPSHDVYDQMTCASAVIGSRWLLSAAQCVSDLGTPGEIPVADKTAWRTRVGLDRLAGGATANVTGIYKSPFFTGEVGKPGGEETGDIVLMRLDRRLDVQPVPIAHRPRVPGRP